MGSRRYPGRRPIRGWQLTAVVGAVGAVALAGCSSGGSSSTSSSSGTTGGATSSASGSATSGSIVWSASPIAGAGATDTRTVLISAFEKKYPGIHVTLTSAPTNTDTNRATLATEISGGSATPDVFMGDVIWPAQFGAHQLAVPLSDYLPQSYWSQFAPGLVTPAAVSTFQEAQSMSIFAAGNAGFLRNWDYAYSNATTPATGKLTASQVGVEPMPAFAGQPTPGYSNIGGWNMYINPHSKNINVDLTFIKWLASDQAQTILATKYSEIPTTNSVRNSPAVKSLNPVLAIISQTKLVPRPAGTPNYPALSTAIYTNV